MSENKSITLDNQPHTLILEDHELIEPYGSQAEGNIGIICEIQEISNIDPTVECTPDISSSVTNIRRERLSKSRAKIFMRQETESNRDDLESNSSDVQDDNEFLEVCKMAANKRMMAMQSEEENGFESDDEERLARSTKRSRRRIKKEVVDNDEKKHILIHEEACFLCEESLEGEVTVMTMRLHVPLPSSFLSPLSLLRYYGVSFTVSDVELGNIVKVNVCWKCHSVVLEGDKAFQNFVSIGASMKSMWPKKTQKCMLLKNLEELCNFENLENYEEEKDEIELVPNKYAGKKRDRNKEKKKARPSDLRVRMCELCGTSCAGIGNWEDHCKVDHKVTKNWIRYTYQFSLKQSIWKKLKEVISEGKHEQKVKCPACKLDFEGKDLSGHIVSYHNIAVDESSLVSGYEKQYMIHTDHTNMVSGHPMAHQHSTIIRSHANDNNHQIVQPCDSVMETGNIEYMDERVSQIGVVCNLCHIFIEGSLLEHIELSHMDIVVLLKRDQTEVSRYRIVTVTALEATDNLRSYKPRRLWKKLKFSCNICGVDRFSDLIKLLDHKRTLHKGCEESRLEYDSALVECQFCGYRVIGTPALRLHTIEKHVQAGDQCSYEYNCKLCIFQSASKEDYKKHMETKHGKNFNQHVQCEVCGKMVSSKYIGVHHKKMHSQSRNYACNMCDMKFFDCQSLKVHFTEEHVDNEYECETCQLKFKKYHQLRQHRIYMHSTKVFKCLYCDATFKRKCDQSSHTKRKHMEREYYYCNFCSKQFNDRSKRNKHLIMVHGVNREDTWSENFARNKRQKGCFHQRPAVRNEIERNPQSMHTMEQKEMHIQNRQMHNPTDGTLIMEQVPQFGGMGFMHPHFTMHH
ncbi:hypothetical protein SK128_019755 [Halocaridina rubra]|uniref:C2H2-type domain-containing protein n=1 Tax=Halocaridina rubra TaxID=373956 RepID=A0AAN8X3Z7_HALRR